MMSIRSIAGDTINEPFYNATALMSIGLGGLALVIAFNHSQARREGMNR